MLYGYSVWNIHSNMFIHPRGIRNYEVTFTTGVHFVNNIYIYIHLFLFFYLHLLNVDAKFSNLIMWSDRRLKFSQTFCHIDVNTFVSRPYLKLSSWKKPFNNKQSCLFWILLVPSRLDPPSLYLDLLNKTSGEHGNTGLAPPLAPSPP